MPFDGIVTKCVVKELSDVIIGGRVEKIFQPEADEILINLRANSENLKLVLSANASYPRIHLTQISKENPSTPPVFCMLLRKYISRGRITSIDFHDYERIVSIGIESANELGDLSEKKLIIEIMGRHSNIILVNSQDKIIDSIKHVDNEISSVREVMPARNYVLPPSQNKESLDNISVDIFIKQLLETASTLPLEKHLLDNIKGFSPLLCREVCYRANINGKTPLLDLDPSAVGNLKEVLLQLFKDITQNNFHPCIIYNNSYSNSKIMVPLDFHCVKMNQYPKVEYLSSISTTLDNFYIQKDGAERLRQRKSDLTKALNSSMDRCNKKISLQQEKLRDVSDREKLQLYGELITANIFSIPEGIKKISLQNYYTENLDIVEIPMDENLSPQQNAQKYFKKYAKAKSAYTNTNRQLKDSLRELDYLEGVVSMLEICSSLQEIDEIRQELIEQGYLSSRKKVANKKKDKPSAPLHFVSTDGMDIYVGKNNNQNDILTMKAASSRDLWLHARNIPGSHVIVRSSGQSVSDQTLLEAAMLAAYYSKSGTSSNVPVDYTMVKHVKKPKGAKPGMVIYDNFKTITVNPREDIPKP